MDAQFFRATIRTIVRRNHNTGMLLMFKSMK